MSERKMVAAGWEGSMAIRDDSLSVLVVEPEYTVLIFLAKLLDANGMRALLARSVEEAIGIAERGYVPIDLVLTDLLLSDGPAMPVSGQEAVVRIRALRPDVQALYMSAQVDADVIRIELTLPDVDAPVKDLDDTGLIDAIRKAAHAPRVQRLGGMSAR
jgi:CheY-like chemotaxis protein